MDRKSTYESRLDRIRSLLLPGIPEPDPTDGRDENEWMAGLLQEQLTRALPRGSLLLDALFVMLNRQGCNTRALAGKSLDDVFLNADSDIDLLAAIRDCTKELSAALDSEAERALATTLYFTALASALVYHDERITHNPFAKLDESFTLLTEKKWMAPELIELFSQARHICAAKESEA